ncbi:MAG: ATP-binding cassette domain-containing protein [Anaerolineae bacterium]|nr:ATP-binding cassette domain-containing protein [Anaerolineae bacterium]
MSLAAKHVCFAYLANRPVLRDVTLTVNPGEVLYVLGRNGSGKTTLLSCLAGILQPVSGQVLLNDKDVRQYSPAERARLIGLMPQVHIPAFAYTVREMVLMGRTPHLGLLGTLSRNDYAIADEALESIGLSDLHDRPYTEISGGERQLVLIARGLAQKANILLMDEPSAHLDLSNQHRVLEIVDQLTHQGLSFVISSHAPNNALIYAHHVLLLSHGHVLAYGTPAETLTEERLSAAYGMRAEVIYGQSLDSPMPRAVLPRRPLTLSPESLNNPGSELNQIFEQSQHSPQLLLITGLTGAGKTSWCTRMAQVARSQGLRVKGVLSPSVFEGESKVAIDLLSLETDEKCRLAVQRNDRGAELATVLWQFDPAVMAWGNDILGNLRDSDLVILDELGPLEFLRGQGLVEGLKLIDEKRYRVACVVIRSSLLPDALERWPHAQVVNGYSRV